jgi:hypothetical protein
MIVAMTTAGFLWWIVSVVVWVVLALFLPLISLIIVLILPARSRPPA